MSELEPSSQPRSSSFPISSPSFWEEAAVAAATTAPAGYPSSTSKRPRTRSASPGDDGSLSDPFGPSSKRSRRGSPSTTLSYLPNRADLLADDPHAYLANPEYAPNRFGDIGDYMRKKEIKIQTQNRDIALANAISGLPQIFTGLSFYINGNTHPPMEDLRKMILQRGGEVRPVLRSKGMVKFIIAPMLTQMKFKQFQNYRVVREAWITESCEAGKLLDWSRWKLTVQGGWEEEGRKGLEGFFAGKPSQVSQTVKAERSEAEPVEETEVEVQAKNMLDNDTARQEEARQEEARPNEVAMAKAHTASAGISPVPSAPVTPTRAPSAAIKALLTPMRAPSIPISPGRARADTPGKEQTPTKVQRPEGVWEHYYTKQSNEDAARLMKNQEWRLRNTAERGNEGGFIDGYYQNSRLHHLSTWKAELKVLVASAQRQSEELSLKGPSTTTVSPLSLSTSTLPRAATSAAATGERVIFHVDFDCFFVSCGLATRPHLKGKPSVVCHSQAGRGASSTSEIASASYEARAKGVKNGMSLGRARTLVGEDLQTIPYEFETYKKFSLAFYTVLMGYADELQAVSVDEALIDVTSAVAAREAAPEEAVGAIEGEVAEEPRARDPAIEIAEKIRDDVRKLTEGCEVSIGISHNVLLAKLATRRAKPAGVFHLKTPDVPDFLAPLDVEDFPSVGYSIRSKIEETFESTTCGDLLQHGKGSFQRVLGPKTGEMLYGYLRGIDERKLEPHKERKSISAEMNYGIRFQSQDQAEMCVRDLAAEVSKRMKQVNARGRLLTLKLLKRHPDAPIEPPKFLGHGWCETFNKSAPAFNKGGSATDDPAVLGAEAVKLLRAMRLDPVELRGVGIQITKLDGEAKVAEREVGQGTLSFAKKRTANEAVAMERQASEGPPKPASKVELGETTSHAVEPTDTPTIGFGVSPPPRSVSPRSASPEPEAVPRPPIQRNASAGPSRAGPSASSEGIDPEFLAALPPDLRHEVKRDFARTRATSEKPNTTKLPAEAVVLPSTTVSPAKDQGKHAVAHITKQLRPKLKTQLKATAVADLPLYGAWAKANDKDKDKEVMDLTMEPIENEMIGAYLISELVELGVDPGVFSELPEDLQKEVVKEERAKARKRKILHRPADTSRSRGTGRNAVRTASISPSRSSRAGSTVPAQSHLTITRPSKPTLLKATSLPDVLETVTRWIESRGGAGPAAKDANKVKAYLVKCMAPEAGMGGPENAVEVLRWMRSLLRDMWDPRGTDGEAGAGKEWWDTWAGFRDQVDRISRERFGAGIRL